MTSMAELSQSLTFTIYLGRRISDNSCRISIHLGFQGQSRFMLIVLIGLLMVPYCTATSPPVDKMLHGHAAYT